MYRPTAKVHAANDALMVRAYKHVTGISRHAHTDALWGPWEHGCQGLTRSEHSWQAAVVREWVRQGAWAKQEFRDSQAYYLQTHQALRGGCPAVLTPGQYTYHPKCPHLIATLQRVVDEVAMPMWMPGQCSGTTPILVRGPGGPRSAAAAAPAPRVEVYATCMAPSRRWPSPRRCTKRYRPWATITSATSTQRITRCFRSEP